VDFKCAPSKFEAPLEDRTTETMVQYIPSISIQFAIKESTIQFDSDEEVCKVAGIFGHMNVKGKAEIKIRR
jgi:hypothetical protein